MTEITESVEPEYTYYMPHHGIYRPQKSTTKLRTVFNASALTANGRSLNSIQYNGGVIQDDLFSLLVRFRKHIYAFTEDIRQMYRMIDVDVSRRPLQRILWKGDVNEPVKVYQLNTVTYGTASAPFLAMRTLKQISIDEGENFPLAASVLCDDFYMDDVLSGANSLRLQKPCNINSLTFYKLLRCPCINGVEVERNAHPTKRSVLSIIARLFDPLGLLGPVITKAKIFMQQLWTLQIDWSERLPEKEASEWKEFVRSLVALNGINIERCIVIPNAEVIELHGFCDASERAYGAAIYARSINPDGEIKVKLVASKSRVSPVKQVTMPRLELCSAVLLAKLMHKVKRALRMDITSVFFWTDSTIVLSWMKNESRNLKTFVANRVVIIQELTELNKWHHVPSEQNPADIISRGLDPEKIQRSELWWFGPAFLEVSSVNFPRYVDEIHNCEHYQRELKDNQESMCFLVQNREILPIIDKCSSFLKLQRILAWCVRFKENARNPLQLTTGSLTVAELSTALIFLVRNVQSVSFAKEIWCLERRQPLPVSSTEANIRTRFWIVNGRSKRSKASNVLRGRPSDIFSDNGTNFVGANNEFRKILKGLFKKESSEKFEDFLASESIQWHFNPPAAPHFGGLWEAGVKSLKSHLKRVVGNNIYILTHEEFFTLVTQVEAVLNSRPLCSLSEDPNDLALTPAHFLTGSPLTSLLDPDFKGIPMNRLRRWELVQRMTQTFWSR
ncbi:integrase catalytic domain-containing protein [Trichonephila clavipes]|nr:integrase catalytic domain-containing protein [Trichonephila clavipes]